MDFKTYRPLEILIDNSGMKISAIAEKMGLSTTMFWRMRVDPRRMGIEHMERLADILGLSFMDIYTVQKNFRNEVDKNTTQKVQNN